MGKLYIVATPIGNLADITLRAIRVLKEVDLILAEDTRRTGILLKHFGIKKPQLSFSEFNEEKRIPQVLAKLKSGQDIAIVSDAGTPLISDPGFKLIRQVIAAGIELDSIPGPSAVLTALTISGMPCDKFLFLGYLPKLKGKLEKILSNLKKILKIQKTTVILFESPYRLTQTLIKIKNTFGEIDVVICRELTKIYQKVTREKISQSIENFTQTKPKGEITIVFNPEEKGQS